MSKELTLFDFLNSIFYKKNLQYNKKIAPAYMLTMYLSHCEDLMETVNEINKFQFSLPDEHIYTYYWYKVPRGKRYIKWTKKSEIDKKVDKKIKEIAIEYNISELEAKNFIDLVRNNK
jgi:hypothetical protein